MKISISVASKIPMLVRNLLSGLRFVVRMFIIIVALVHYDQAAVT
jgi:hypothetical protein